jgi:hypothetical protein
MGELVIPVPGARPAAMLLSANDRRHWRTRSRLTRHWRGLAMVMCRSAINRGELRRVDSARIDVWFSFPTNQRRDVGNLYPTVKACIDGFVDAGLMPDDDDSHLDGPFLHRGEQGPCSMRFVVTGRV